MIASIPQLYSSSGGRVLPAKWILVFILWTVASFACHHQGKVFLQQASAILNVDERTDDLVLGILALALSAAQLTICVLLTSLETSTPSKDLNVETIEKTFASYYVAIAGHVLTTVLTNWSLARMEAASTLAVKLTEPIVSAMVQRMWMGQRLSMTTWWSLIVVVDGALLFTSDGAGIQQIVTIGVVLAMMSNVVLAARNLALKRLYGGDFRVTLVPWNRVVMVILALVLGIFFLQLLEVEGRVTKGRTTTFFAMVLSGLFHVCYSVVSTGVVLRALDVVSHALANICKRVLVVMLLYVFGTRRGTMTNGFGLGLALLGLLLYVRERIRSRRNVTDDTKVACTERLKVIMVRIMKHIPKKICLVILLISVWCAVHLGFQSISSHFDLRHSTIPMGLHSSSSGFNLRTGIQWSGPPSNHALLSEWSEFLSLNLTKTPFDTDKLAGRMRTNDEVVWGTQQLLLNVLRSLLGGRRHAMLMEIEVHENKGDPAITLGDLTLLRHLNISIVFYCDIFNCTNSTLSLARNISSLYSPDSLVIFMQGGGNLVGYKAADIVRARVLKVFPDFPVILLSQSIWIHRYNLKHLNDCRQIYSNQANLTIFLRDRQSLALAQKYFIGTRLILMPDLAFCIGRVPRFMLPLYDIVWIKRGDNESSQYKMPPIPNEISVYVADWLDSKSNKGLTPLETSVYIAINGLVFLQRGRVVVTDRLHGHILSVLSGIPHVLIDNPPFLKLSSFHRTWTSGLENVVIVNDSEDALKQARGLLQKYGDDLPQVLFK